MLNKPLVSVIMPVYNAKIFLTRSIDALLKQSYDNIEIILIDDASVDGSGVICDAYAKKDSRIVVVHNEQNKGQAAARNIGIKMAKGIYIGFMDDDDLIDPNMYEVLVDNMLQYDVDISMCARVNIDMASNKTFIRDTRESGLYDGRELLINCLRVEGFSGAVWDKLFKREILEKYQFPEGSELEDYWVVFRGLYEYRKVYYDAQPLYMWYIRDSSQSHSRKLKNIDSVYDIADKLWLYYVKNKAEEEIVNAAIYYKFLVCNGIIISAIRNYNIYFLKKYLKLSGENYKKLPKYYKMPIRERIRGSITRLF